MNIGFYDEEFQLEFYNKMLDLYNFLAREKASGGKISFKNGIVFKCEIDISNMKKESEE